MSDALRVLTFNLRLDTTDDGPYAWPYRRDSVGRFLNMFRPGIAGLQEVLPSMWHDVLARLPETYRLFGEPRLPGDEAVPLLYDTAQVTFLEGGSFWLSKTPEISGSNDPDAGCVRMSTWGKFARVSNPATVFRVYNTHLDHLSEAARVRGFEVIVKMMRQHHNRQALPIVLMGDFNALPDAVVFQPLLRFNESLDAMWRLMDVQAGTPAKSRATFHRFKGLATAAIDHIFVSRILGAHTVQVHTTSQGALPLSDHHPLSVEIDFSFAPFEAKTS
ncbi:MAG: endonuclease/exonuclease/phosphatase family protein [Acholeplasmatales bacterium]|nr:MAG: endonuclease/exonuclease/phosphatase family protein [Acholeplasmatales bacterium]